MITSNTKSNFIKKIIILQMIIAIYCCSTVVAKFASAEEFSSLRFWVLYGTEIAILGIYALLWQQIIKHFPITIAYANRAVGLFWSVIFALVIFHETITIKNIIGVIVVVIGTMIVNSEDE
jgi:multidrug transporter EmrE-like cation transporter